MHLSSFKIKTKIKMGDFFKQICINLINLISNTILSNQLLKNRPIKLRNSKFDFWFFCDIFVLFSYGDKL